MAFLLGLTASVNGADARAANALFEHGVRAYEAGRTGDALEAWSRALKEYEAIEGAETDRAKCHQNMAVAFSQIGKYSEALREGEDAVKLYGSVPGSERQQAKCLGNTGETLRLMGRWWDAVAQELRALEILRSLPDAWDDQAECFVNIGAALNDAGKFEQAIANFEVALDLFKLGGGTRLHQAACHANIAVSLASMGLYQEAITRSERAVALARESGAEAAQAGCMVNIGSALRHLGRHDEAFRQYEHALSVFQTGEGHEREQAVCYTKLAEILSDQRQYQDAIHRLRRSAAMFEKIEGAQGDQALCWVRIGESLRHLGQMDSAIAVFEKLNFSWRTSREMGLALAARGESGDIGRALQQLVQSVRHAEAKRTSVAAFEHQAAIFDDPSVVFADLTALLVRVAETGESVDLPGLSPWTQNPSRGSALLHAAFHSAGQGKGRALHDLIRERSTSGRWIDQGHLEEDKDLSLRLSRLSALRERLPNVEFVERRKLDEEIEALQQRRNMLEVELKKTTLGGYVAPQFRKPMDMAKELEADRAVLQYSVGEKEGWLLILTRDGVTAHKVGADTPALPELLARQESTIEQLAEAWKKRPDKIGLDGLVRLARARAENLGKRESERSNLINAEQEKATLERLSAAVLPDSALTELRTKGIHRLLVIPDGSLHYIPFAMLRLGGVMEKGSGGVLGQTHYLVEEFASSYVPAMTTLDTIRKQKKEREAKRKAARRELLAFANPTYGSEAGPTLPASVAKDDMVTRLRSFRTDYYKGGGLHLTSLPETEHEAVRVASLFAPPKTFNKLLTDAPDARAAIFVGKGAAEEQVKRLLAVPLSSQITTNESRITSHELRLPAWRYLLFSTHGLADTHNGMLSCLALSSPTVESEEDGFLQAQEVMNLELDTDLVMLSACQTGLGRLRGGEGLVGLSAAFFYAGAESVCASLWQVPSGPTSQLVPEFFKQLKEGKVDKAEALRQAQLQVLRQGQGPDGKSADYSTPFCWAAFVLMGEYR